MPNKIPLEKIKELLPPFVEIIPESYRGVRYTAEFIDLEYNETFRANPKSVIQLQHGCKTRSNKLRSIAGLAQNIKGVFSGQNKIPIEEIKAKLPPFLEIDEESYKGSRFNARFYDKEYNIWFETTPANLLRNGKGYCKERQQDEFKKSITMTANEVQDKINSIYENRVVLIQESYINTNTPCFWIIDGERKMRKSPSFMFSEKLFVRQELERWKFRVLVRDEFTCINCGSEEDVCAHHIEPWVKNKELRFTVSNGATLCKECHNNYHSLYHRIETSENFQEFLSKSKPESAFT